MAEKLDKQRYQLNLRLDKEPELLDEIKNAAEKRSVNITTFVLDAVRAALGKPTSTPSPAPSWDQINERLEHLIDNKLEERLGKVERRLRDEVKVQPHQQPTSQLSSTDYQAVRDSRRLLAARDRILKEWKVAKRAESKERIALVLDQFIQALEAEQPSTEPAPSTKEPLPPAVTRTEFEDLKKRISGTQVGLMNEIRKRDDQIAALAEVVARLDSADSDPIPPALDSISPSDLTDEEIEKLTPWKQWEAVCTDMIDDFRWEDMWRGRD